MQYLIVGLNNPGQEYEETRHNVGKDFVFSMLKKLADKGIDIPSFSKEGNYEYCRVKAGEFEAIFLLPTTFINLSGEAVAKAKNFYKIENDHVIVACDDVNLEVGSIRRRFGGSDGGHNGLKSVIASIGEGFWRVRIGIGMNDIALESYVLQKIEPAQRLMVDKIIDEEVQNMIELLSSDSLENTTKKNK